ncbi:MAG: hypothetical protein M3209_14320 [Acidobacteriota bacterium]|nr:hypothetical protein [Acidobacteriota bacterium]
MRPLQKIILLSLVCLVAIGGVVQNVSGQTNRRATSERQMRTLIQRIRVQADNFKNSFDESIQNIRLRGTQAENIHRDIEDFQRALTDFETRFNGRDATSADAQTVLDEARDINSFLQTTRLGTRVNRDWTALRGSLDELGREYNLNARWEGGNYPGNSQNYPANTTNYPNNSNFNSRLNGTYQLDYERSDNPSEAAERAVANLPQNRRDSSRQTLEQRLDAPERIAIEQRGRSITIASTRAPRFTFEADGRDKYETADNGTRLRVRATLAGERLEIQTSGELRGNDYIVTFEPLDNGRTLRVERRLYADFLRQPVVVQSFYTKNSELAQLDIYDRPSDLPRDTTTGTTTASSDYVVNNGTVLSATLNETISTKEANDRDRFSMTVESPAEFRGAIIEGYISGIARSGKVTGRSQLTFNFETIRTRDGKIHNFAGFVEAIRTPGGETVKVDNEGTAQGDNQGKTTATRGAIGAGVGAIIGAIAGGGKGAAIGAIIGGGAGAGSVYIEGRDDLNLTSGSEITIRASAPNRNNR